MDSEEFAGEERKPDHEEAGVRVKAGHRNAVPAKVQSELARRKKREEGESGSAEGESGSAEGITSVSWGQTEERTMRALRGLLWL